MKHSHKVFLFALVVCSALLLLAFMGTLHAEDGFSKTPKAILAAQAGMAGEWNLASCTISPGGFNVQAFDDKIGEDLLTDDYLDTPIFEVVQTVKIGGPRADNSEIRPAKKGYFSFTDMQNGLNPEEGKITHRLWFERTWYDDMGIPYHGVRVMTVLSSGRLLGVYYPRMGEANGPNDRIYIFGRRGTKDTLLAFYEEAGAVCRRSSDASGQGPLFETSPIREWAETVFPRKKQPK